MSWDLSIVETRFPDTICAAAWSPYGGFVAIARPSSSEIAVLDAVTLDRLYTMCITSRVHGLKHLVFSPDSRLLTCHWSTAYSANYIVTWDLQTGGLISDINIPRDFWSYHSMSYSGRGTKFGVLFKGAGVPTIIIYDVLSGAHIFSHAVNKSVTDTIWTHEECLRFATAELGSITIWEVGFTSRHAPTEVDSLPTPDNFPSTEFLLFPPLSRLAFILQGRVLVWDARRLKILLDSADVKNPRDMSFSPDGRFFVCGTEGAEFYLWKESPDGYLLHQSLVSSAGPTKQTFSPNGGSIVAFGGPMVQRWRTTSSRTSLQSVSTQSSQHILEDFILDFSPDRTSAVFARRWENAVTVLDLRSCVLSSIVNAGTGVCGLGLRSSRGKYVIAVVGYGKIVTWDLWDHAIPRASTNYPVPTTASGHSGLRLYASVSSAFDRIVVKEAGRWEGDLCVYEVRTGKSLAVVRSKGYTVGFRLELEHSAEYSQDSVWCARADGDVDEWDISGAFGSTFPVPIHRKPDGPQEAFPWQSSRGYQVTDDGWIISSGGKRLLWLPHHWRSGSMTRRWSEHLLALSHGELPAPVVLELEV